MASPQQSKSFSIVIIGGGIAGLSLARGLIVRGVDCQVYESAPAFAEIGAGLGLALNGIEALKLIDPACAAALERRVETVSATQDAYMTYRDGLSDDGTPLTTLYCNGSGMKAVHRTMIVKDMAALMPDDRFHMGKKLQGIQGLPSGSFHLYFQDGSTVEADVVLGADGIKSTLRPYVLGEHHPDAYPKYSGEFVYRGLIPMQRAVDVLGETYVKNGNVLIGDGALTTTYPVEKGTLLNVVAARASPTWDSPDWVVPGDRAALDREFQAYGQKMRQVVSLLQEPQKWSVWHHPTAPTFHLGRVALVGDAAHAATPHQGAGTGQALEDALVMSDLLAHVSVQSVDDVDLAFAAYDAVRRPRSLRVAKTSLENGEICMMRGRETGADLANIRANVDRRFDWIWYEDLPKQVKRALAELARLQNLRKVNEKSSHHPRLIV